MKKILSLIFALALVILSLACFASCGPDDGADSSNKSQSDSAPSINDIIVNSDGSITLPDDEFE